MTARTVAGIVLAVILGVAHGYLLALDRAIRRVWGLS